MAFIGSFELDGTRHLILSEPTDRTLIVDTFCGKQFSQLGAGDIYVSLPRRSDVCPDCLGQVDALIERIER